MHVHTIDVMVVWVIYFDGANDTMCTSMYEVLVVFAAVGVSGDA